MPINFRFEVWESAINIHERGDDECRKREGCGGEKEHIENGDNAKKVDTEAGHSLFLF